MATHEVEIVGHGKLLIEFEAPQWDGRQFPGSKGRWWFRAVLDHSQAQEEFRKLERKNVQFLLTDEFVLYARWNEGPMVVRQSAHSTDYLLPPYSVRHDEETRPIPREILDKLAPIFRTEAERVGKVTEAS